MICFLEKARRFKGFAIISVKGNSYRNVRIHLLDMNKKETIGIMSGLNKKSDFIWLAINCSYDMMSYPKLMLKNEASTFKWPWL